jgi:hypothetical protein
MNGSTLGNNWQVNQVQVSSFDCSISALNNDYYVIVWTRDICLCGTLSIYGNIYDIHQQSIISSGAAEFRVSSSSQNPICCSAVSNITNDTFVVAWVDNYDIINARVLWNNGTSVQNQFRVNTFAASNQTYPSITAFASAEDVIAYSYSYFVISWTSYEQDGDSSAEANLYAQIFDSLSLVSIGDEFRINNFTAGHQRNEGKHALALLTSNSFVAVWESNGSGSGNGSVLGGVYAQRFVLEVNNFSNTTATTTSTHFSSTNTTKSSIFLSSNKNGNNFLLKVLIVAAVLLALLMFLYVVFVVRRAGTRVLPRFQLTKTQGQQQQQSDILEKHAMDDAREGVAGENSLTLEDVELYANGVGSGTGVGVGVGIGSETETETGSGTGREAGSAADIDIGDV